MCHTKSVKGLAYWNSILYLQKFIKVTWVGVGHVWQARLMSWLMINMSMLMNAQMIYNYRSITKS